MNSKIENYIFSRYSLPRAAGVLLLGTVGEIQKYSLESMETACRIKENKLIHPFAFRVHTHELGKFLLLIGLVHEVLPIKFVRVVVEMYIQRVTQHLDMEC